MSSVPVAFTESFTRTCYMPGATLDDRTTQMIKNRNMYSAREKRANNYSSRGTSCNERRNHLNSDLVRLIPKYFFLSYHEENSSPYFFSVSPLVVQYTEKLLTIYMNLYPATLWNAFISSDVLVVF